MILNCKYSLTPCQNNCDSVGVCGHHLGFILLSPSLQGSHQPGVWGCSRDQRSSAEEKGTWMDREKRGREMEWSRKDWESWENAMLVKNTVERIWGNSIRYSFTLPRSIYRIASVSLSSFFLPSCKKRGKTETDRGRRKREREIVLREERGWGERREMKRYGTVCAWA